MQTWKPCHSKYKICRTSFYAEDCLNLGSQQMLYIELAGTYYITGLFCHLKQCCVYEMLVDQMPIRAPFFISS